MTEMAFLVELDHTAPDGSDPRTERWTDTAVRPMPEDDPDRPGAEWDERLIDPPTVTLEAPIDPTRDAATSYGALSLAAGDGGLAHLSGRRLVEVRCYCGPAEATAFADYRLWLRGRPSLPDRSVSSSRPARLLIGVTSLLADLDDDIHTARYAGTNSGAAGVEGGEDDRDRVKPLAWGDLTAAHIEPVRANAVVPVLQTSATGHDGAVTIYSGGGDAGLGWLAPVTGAAFDGAVPSATQAVEDRTRGLVKLGGTLTHVTTLGYRASPPAACGAAAVAAALLTRRGSGALGPSLTAPTPAASPTIGLYLPDTTTYAAALRLVTRSLAGWVIPDATGTWHLGVLADPADLVPAVEWDEGDIVDVSPDDRELSRPVWEVTVKWGRIHKTFGRADLADALKDTATAEALRKEYREVVRRRQATKDTYGTDARPLSVEALLRGEADAAALADRLLACLGPRADGTPRESWSVTVALTDAHLSLALGAVVRFGLPPHIAPANFLIRRIRPAQPRRGLITFGLWG